MIVEPKGNMMVIYESPEYDEESDKELDKIKLEVAVA